MTTKLDVKKTNLFLRTTKRPLLQNLISVSVLILNKINEKSFSINEHLVNVIQKRYIVQLFLLYLPVKSFQMWSMASLLAWLLQNSWNMINYKIFLTWNRRHVLSLLIHISHMLLKRNRNNNLTGL